MESKKKNRPEEKFEDRLKQLIEKRFSGRWTHLAREAALSQGSVNNYLRGFSKPGYKQISQICEVSGASANWLILGEGPIFRGKSKNQKFFMLNR